MWSLVAKQGEALTSDHVTRLEMTKYTQQIVTVNCNTAFNTTTETIFA